MIEILLADDQALLRSTFRLLIDSCDDMTVVAEAANGEERRSSPGCTGPTWS
jgi:DNA-binding NarL/FixJ family response regulator